MKRKLALILCLMFTLILSVFAFAACDKTPATPDGDNTNIGGDNSGDNQGGNTGDNDDNQGGNQGGNTGGDTQKDTYTLTATPNSIKITLAKGQPNTAQITITVKKNGSNFDGATVTCKSLNEAAATVDNSGLVTGIAPGNADISVKAEIEGQTPLTKLVQVSVEVPPTSRSLDNSTRNVVGTAVDFTATEVADEGSVYEVKDGTVSFTDAQLAELDTKYAAGYTYMTFDVKFPTTVSERITANLGGTELIFRNNNVQVDGGYWAEGARGENNMPKNLVNKAGANETAFVIYDSNGDAVCDLGCNGSVNE